VIRRLFLVLFSGLLLTVLLGSTKRVTFPSYQGRKADLAGEPQELPGGNFRSEAPTHVPRLRLASIAAPERTSAIELIAQDGADDDHLGSSVAVSADGGTAVATTQNRGAAYVFERSKAGWTSTTPIAKLTPTDAVEVVSSLGISGDGRTVVFGVWKTGPGKGKGGAAYVFVRPVSGWANHTQDAKLSTADDHDSAGESIWSIAVSEDGRTVVLGAPEVAGGGAAYVFGRSLGGWSSTPRAARLTISGGAKWAFLGKSLAVSGNGDTIVAGAPGLSTLGPRAAVYVFSRHGDRWTDATKIARLATSDGADYDHLGESVAVSRDGSTVVAGAPIDGSVKVRGRDAAYMFVRPLRGWTDMVQTATLTASDGPFGFFGLGCSVALSGDGKTAVAGGTGATGHGAYLFERRAGRWASSTESVVLTPRFRQTGDGGGGSVGVSGDGMTVVVGAPYRNGHGVRSGAAWIFVVSSQAAMVRLTAARAPEPECPGAFVPRQALDRRSAP
jgi:FG-GAP repeat